MYRRIVSPLVFVMAGLLLILIVVACTPYVVTSSSTVIATPFTPFAMTVRETVTPAASLSASLPVTSPVEFVWALPYGTLLYPRSLGTDPQGNVYVTDSLYNRIQKFDANGKFLTMWGGTGIDAGHFVLVCKGGCVPLCQGPTCPGLPSGGMAVDAEGHVFVSDYAKRIQKFDHDGHFLLQWGSQGTGDGQFTNAVYGLAVDPQGNIYAADSDGHRIQKFDNNGHFLGKWGSQGDGNGQFAFPQAIAVDRQGNVYIADPDQYRIQKFDGNGQFLTMWGSEGEGQGQFLALSGIAVDSQSNVYAVDTLMHRVVKFDSNGQFLGQWGSLGIGNGQFYNPADLTIDRDDNIYVTELLSHRVQKFRQK